MLPISPSFSISLSVQTVREHEIYREFLDHLVSVHPSLQTTIRHAQPYFFGSDHASLGPHGVDFRIILLYEAWGHDKENPCLRQLSLN